MLKSFDDTIIALSTPSGPSLRAILRISGPHAFHCLDYIFTPLEKMPIGGLNAPQEFLTGLTQELPANNYQSIKKNKHVCYVESSASEIEKIPTFRSVNGYIVIKKEQTHIPVTLYIMKAPYSFTKEDVIEIHTIGSAPIIEMILSEILFNKKAIKLNNMKVRHSSNKPLEGCVGHAVYNYEAKGEIRLAEPGEFTKRAFLNGRIDLTQAEAVIKIIRSRSDSELLAGMSVLKGEVRFLIDGLRDQLVNLCGKVEASIDFSDQDISLISHQEIEDSLYLIYNELINLNSENKRERQIHDEGINVIFYGRPNVGKSSLLNAFGPDIKTIVSDTPHTTRDSVKRTIKIDNLCFYFFDNPGIDIVLEDLENRNCFAKTNNVNFQSITRSQQSLHQADIVIFVLDGSCELSDLDRNLLAKLKDKKKIVVINKYDLPQKINLDGLVCNRDGAPVIKTSAINRKGIADLKKELINYVLKGSIDQSGSHLIMNARQKAVLSKAINFIDYALKTTKNRESLEFIALDLRNALDAIGEIVGHLLTDDILDKIFSEFCIGK